jgi:hypothetical protein
MEPSMTTMELQDQAAAYARDMVAFLEEQNAHEPSPHGPFRSPQSSSGVFEFLFRRFVARRRVVRP